MFNQLLLATKKCGLHPQLGIFILGHNLELRGKTRGKSIKICADDYVFRTSGSSIKFPGFTKVYGEAEEDETVKIPELNEKDILKLKDIKGDQHFTQPPARYTDASLVKTLEEIGVGRPSTYAPTISVILARNYVTKESKLFYPTELGEIVNDIMKNYFEDIVAVDFTANMEDTLDRVEDGDMEWKEISLPVRILPVLKRSWMP